MDSYMLTKDFIAEFMKAGLYVTDVHFCDGSGYITFSNGCNTLEVYQDEDMEYVFWNHEDLEQSLRFNFVKTEIADGMAYINLYAADNETLVGVLSFQK